MLSFLNVPLRAWYNIIKKITWVAIKFKNQRATKDDFDTPLKIILKVIKDLLLCVAH